MRYNEKLKMIRENAGMSQEQLAHALGVRKSAVSNWEQGIRKPRHELMGQIAALFNSSVDVLFFDESDRLR